MTLGAVADDAAGVARARRQQIAGEIDAEDDALADVGLGVVDETLACVQVAQLVGGELRMTVAEADLRQPRAFAHQHREGARRNLGIERAVIAGLDAVEAARLVGDDAGEDVEPAGRALRIGGGGDVLRQRQAFQQRHDIDAAGLQHRAVGKRELVQLEIVDALLDRGAARQKARAHAVGDRAETQVEARRLDLVSGKRPRRQDRAVRGQRGDHAVGQNALVLIGESECHAVSSS